MQDEAVKEAEAAGEEFVEDDEEEDEDDEDEEIEYLNEADVNLEEVRHACFLDATSCGMRSAGHMSSALPGL